MKLKKNILEKVAASPGIRGRICAETGKSYPTIQKWVEDNDEKLTLASSMKVIREELKLTDSEILENGTK